MPAWREAVGRFEAEQAAADHHGAAAAGGGGQHGFDVGDVAEADDARQVAADHGEDERVGAGGQQQHVVRARRAVLAVDHALGAVDVPDPLARDQLDAVLRSYQALVVDDDLVEGLLAAPAPG